MKVSSKQKAVSSKYRERNASRSVIVLVCLLLTALLPTGFLWAQQPTKVPRIGILETSTGVNISPRIEAFRQGLRDLGYTEAQNITVEYRYADGKSERIPDLAAELVNLKVDVIVTSQTPPVIAIKKISSTISIVFVFLSFPVENGIVDSFARPGGNATGMTVLSEELNGKRLELLRDTSPNIKRVGVLSNPANPTQPLEWKAIEAAAVTMRLRLEQLSVRSAADLVWYLRRH
jgi:putative tryptophan/tyrosine transport system substrate-binding protein